MKTKLLNELAEVEKKLKDEKTATNDLKSYQFELMNDILKNGGSHADIAAVIIKNRF